MVRFYGKEWRGDSVHLDVRAGEAQWKRCDGCVEERSASEMIAGNADDAARSKGIGAAGDVADSIRGDRRRLRGRAGARSSIDIDLTSEPKEPLR